MAAQKRILFVEDDLYTRDLYTEELRAAGFDVDIATDGEAGLTKALSGGYALLVFDIMLPKRDGLQVLSELKIKSPKTANGPIVILTNLAHDKVLNDAMKKGAKACLIKTDFNPDQLVKKLQSYIE